MKSSAKALMLSLTTMIFVYAVPLVARAAQPSNVDSGDTTFVLMSAALVLLMTPGLGLFYGGMVRKKNVLNIMVQCFVTVGLVSVQWIICGYSLAFGPDIGHIIGSLEWAGFAGVGSLPNSIYAGTIPHGTFAIFQLMFAVITAALITGSFAERLRFSVFVIFILLWSTLVYDPVAHWVWGAGGWLKNLGVLDFAGGNVVEICSGFSGLAVAIAVGRRTGYGREPILPHNLPLTMVGAGLLWFGWFGFNAGSALAANGIASNAFITTNTAAAAGTLSWLIAEYMDHGKPTMLGAVSGAVASLVAITPACGFVSPMSALFIGLVAGPVCYLAVGKFKQLMGYDDALDVFGIHGVGGMIGTLATGILASIAINPSGADGLLFGNAHTFLIQLLAVGATCLYAGTMSFIIMKAIGLFVPLRAEDEDEEAGLDVSHHGEEAYRYEASMVGPAS
ncbi:MAG: ammonium transporter [Deltaproteobacteria bacterium]